MRNTEKLLSIMQKYPVLYDESHSDYKNIRAKDKIWTEIGKEFNESGEEVKKKWKNLRDTYAKFIKNIKRKTSQGATETKTKVWVWAPYMEVFRPFLTFSKTPHHTSKVKPVLSTSEGVTGSEDDTFEAENTQLPSESNSVECTEGMGMKDTNPYIPNNGQSPHSMPSQLELTGPVTPSASEEIQKKKKRKRDISPSSPVVDMIKYFENKKNMEHDAIDLLMLAHAKTIKTFSGRRQIITKMKIAQVIMEQELLNHEEPELLSQNQMLL